MKKTFLLSSVFVLVLSSLLFISSCSKKNDPAPSRDQLLATAKGWKLTNVTLTSSANVTQTIFSSIPTCVADNIIYFKSTGAYLEDEGASKCDSTDPQTVESGTWKFNTDKTVITVTSSDPTNPDIASQTIASLTATTLVIKMNIDVGGVTFVGNYTFTAQ
jgi:hypothetical protein